MENTSRTARILASADHAAQRSRLLRLGLGALAAGVLALLANGNASATIIDNGWYTTDTGSGLEWADVTLTNNLSWHQIQAGAGHSQHAANGWLNAGWRYATHNEVLLFWESIAGIRFTDSNQSAGSDVQGLIGALVGNTRFGYGSRGVYRSTYGMVAENVNSYYTHWMGLHHYDTINSVYGVNLSANITANGHSGWGSWLVRSTATDVPEPGTIALLALGLLSLGATRRRTAG